MKNGLYSPDLFMGEIYDKVCAKPLTFRLNKNQDRTCSSVPLFSG